MPRIGVVIVNYNGRAYIADCLASLLASTLPPSVIAVVDNCSTDGSDLMIAERFPGVTLIRHRTNSGFAGGVNVGAEHCFAHGCEAILLLNPDTVVEPQTIGAFANAMERHPNALLSPAIFYFDEPDISDSYAGWVQWWRGRMRSEFLGRDRARLPQSDTRVGTASFCCLLIPSAVMRRVGPLDEAYFLYFEDADYLERTAAAGYELWYVPEARLFHKESSATGGAQSPLALYYYVRNRHAFLRKFQRGRPVYIAFVAYAAADAVRRTILTLARGRPSLAVAALRGTIDGFSGRLGRARAY